jgi:hypothetical protein
MIVVFVRTTHICKVAVVMLRVKVERALVLLHFQVIFCEAIKSSDTVNNAIVYACSVEPWN